MFIFISKELNGEEIDKSDSRHDLYDENEEYFYYLGTCVLEYYGYAIDALSSPDSMTEQFFDDELNELIKLKGFIVETEGYEGTDS